MGGPMKEYLIESATDIYSDGSSIEGVSVFAGGSEGRSPLLRRTRGGLSPD